MRRADKVNNRIIQKMIKKAFNRTIKGTKIRPIKEQSYKKKEQQQDGRGQEVGSPVAGYSLFPGLVQWCEMR
jgi:hypothetical protein